ncbi:MAG: hypothetical protein QM762_26350 [Chryseolinea sp.]
MKTIMIIISLWFWSQSAIAQSPNVNEWVRQKKTQRQYLIQQIAALKVYLGYVKKGYQIAQKGLTTISEIKNGTFSLDKDYFASLKSVSSIVLKSPKVNEILVYHRAISESLKKFLVACRNDQQLTSIEITYIEDVSHKVLNQCNGALDELTLITTAGQTEMQDGKRLGRLDEIHREIQDLYVFSCEFIETTNLLSTYRRKQQDQLNIARKLADPT